MFDLQCFADSSRISRQVRDESEADNTVSVRGSARPALDDQIQNHNLDRFIVLVQRRDPDLGDALFRFRARRLCLQFLAHDVQPVARSHRTRPAYLFQAYVSAALRWRKAQKEFELAFGTDKAADLRSILPRVMSAA